MKNDQSLSSLSYLSALFLPILIPAIMFFVMKDNDYVRHHTKRAFWSQLIPYAALTIIFVGTIFATMVLVEASGDSFMTVVIFALAIGYPIIFLTLGIWSIFQALNVMRDV